MSTSLRKPLAVAVAALALGTGTAVATATDAGRTDRIISGSVADPAQWPFAAAMYAQPKRSNPREFFVCGGAVIAPRFVVTAAHCVEGARPSQLAFVVGRPVLTDESVGQRIDVKSIAVDRGYRPPFFRGDVAILELRADANVTPAVLPNPTQDAEATTTGAPVRLAGWGGTRRDGRKVSKTLLQADERVLQERSCQRFYGRSFSNAKQICIRGNRAAGGRGIQGSCFGDSGGPLVADTLAGPLLVGVVSGGGQLCATQPEYYTRLASFLRFIERESGVVPASP